MKTLLIVFPVDSEVSVSIVVAYTTYVVDTIDIDSFLFI